MLCLDGIFFKYLPVNSVNLLIYFFFFYFSILCTGYNKVKLLIWFSLWQVPMDEAEEVDLIS